MADALETARAWLDGCDRVLIGAGAGMTAAAGIDYGDQAAFARLFPAFRKLGFRAQYQLIGFEGLTPAQFWGYWSTHVNYVRFGEDRRPAYEALRRLVGAKDTFVLTSNVDRFFPRNGFDEQQLYTPQGDYALMQCRTPCVRQAWPTRPFIERALASVDPETQAVTDEAALPRCPSCGGEVFMNVRLDDAFLEEPYQEQATRYRDWVRASVTGRLVVLEFGAGFNTPSVVRWRLEHLVRHHPDARLLRVNATEAEVPTDLGDRALGVRLGAAEAIAALQP